MKTYFKLWTVLFGLAVVSMPAFAEEPHMMHHHENMKMEAAPLARTITATVDFEGTLVQGSDHALSLSLTDAKGAPLTLEGLQEVHTSKIHLLVIDESLMDYKHIHPKPGNAPGTYSFIFRPLTAHNYKVWVDITPVGGKNEVIPVLLNGSAPCVTSCVVKNETLSATVDGLQFSIDMKGEILRVGGTYHPDITIKDAAGQDIADLQPIMGAYAHIVGFYDDFSSLAHMHPMGEEPATDDLRGKSPLSFMLSPTREGFLKMFVQIKRGDKEFFAPVGAVVQPAL